MTGAILKKIEQQRNYYGVNNFNKDKIMKKLFYTVIFIGCGLNSLAQTLTTIYTPNGSAVSDTYIIPEFSASQIAASNSYVETNYPNATRLTDASATYNCHGYAWYMTSPNCGGNVWVGYSSATAEDVFWTDGSYTETNFQASGMKVSYASDNHSAITTTTNNIFKSKWGQLPVMQHDKNYTPYNSSVLKYYLRNQVTGPSIICTTGQFSITNQQSGTSITWSSSNSSGLSIDSNGLAARVNGFNGLVTITATVKSGCGSVTLAGVNVTVGTLAPGSFNQTISPICLNSEKYGCIVQAPNTTYSWVSSSPNLDLGGPCGSTSCATGTCNLIGGYGVGSYSFTITAMRVGQTHKLIKWGFLNVAEVEVEKTISV